MPKKIPTNRVEMSVDYVRHNKDDINAAIDGLGQFCHNFCMSCEETQKRGDLVFRCKVCPFQEEDSTCKVKVFLNKYGTKEQFDQSTSIGSL